MLIEEAPVHRGLFYIDKVALYLHRTFTCFMKSFLCLLFTCGFASAAVSQTDSLKEKLATASGKERIAILNLLIQEDTSEAYRDYFTEGSALAVKLKDVAGEINILCSAGDRFLGDADTALAVINYTRALDLARANGYPNKEMTCLNNLAYVYELKDDPINAERYYMQALSLARKNSYKEGIAITLQNLGIFYIGRRDYGSALKSFSQELEVDRELGDSSLVAACLNNIGLVHYNKGEYAKGIQYYESALEIKRKLGERQAVAQALLNIGIAYREQGAYDKALERLLEAARFFEKKGPSMELASCYNATGNILLELGSIEKALSYHFMALEIREKIGYKRGIAGSLTNIGDAYKRQGNYTQALEYLERSLIIKKEIGDKKLLASTHDHLGDVYFLLKYPGKAEYHYASSVSLKRQIEDPRGMSITFNNLGRLYLSEGKYSKALNSLDSARTMIRNIGAMDLLLENYKHTAQANRKAGNSEEAFAYYELHAALRDSLQNESRNKALAEMQVKYETEKKEHELTLMAEREKVQAAVVAKQELRIWALSAVAILLAVTTVLTLVLIRTSRKAKRQKELMMKELHHRVKNNLLMLSSLVYLQISRSEATSIREALKDVEHRIGAMLLVHQDLYSGTEVAQVNMKDYIPKLMDNLLSASGHTRDRIKTVVSVDPVFLDPDKALSLGLIINELVSNAFKHAFRDTHDPRLDVLLLLSQDNTLRLEINDNGKGMTEGTLREANNSFGLKMVQMFLKDLKGKMDISTGKGTSFSFIIPI
jgi:two-component system, sensor histidine kinase PdtaS